LRNKKEKKNQYGSTLSCPPDEHREITNANFIIFDGKLALRKLNFSKILMVLL
jgi:hypothetical protein